MNEMVLSVVIPAHNEEANLSATVEEVQSTLRGEDIPYEVIIVNDCSSDGTARVIAGLMHEDRNIRTIDRTPPGGFGRAIRTGLSLVEGDVVVPYMADNSDEPRDLVRYYRKIEEGYDCVFGSRFRPGSKVVNYPRFKLIVNRIVNRCIQAMFFCRFNDLTNAFKAYRTHVIRECGPYRASHFNITIEMSLSALIRKYTIAEIPISWYGRTWGSSNLSLKEMGRRYLATLLKVWAEKWLIADDLIADRLAEHAHMANDYARVAARLKEVERRIDSIEDQSQPQTGPAEQSRAKS